MSVLYAADPTRFLRTAIHRRFSVRVAVGAGTMEAELVRCARAVRRANCGALLVCVPVQEKSS